MVLQPVARWNLPPHLDISGFYSAGIVAFDKNGIQQAVFGFNGTGTAIPIASWGQNPQSGSWEYFLTIPPGIPNGNYFLAAAAIANGGTFRQLPNLPVNLWAVAPTYTDFYVNADTGNNGNPGTVGSPFLTLRFALDALAGAGNGGRIYLQNATNPYGLTGITTVPVTTTRYLNIEAAPGASKAQVNLIAWPAAGLGTTKVRFKGITIKTALTGTANDTLLLDDCHLQGTGSGVAIGATGWTPGWGSRYFVDGEVSTCLNGLFAFDMVRGATLTDIGGSAFQSCAYVIDSTSTTSGAGITMISVGAQDNVLCFNVACHDCLVGMELHPALAVTLSNSAFVNVVADATQASQIRDYGLNHVLFFNCTFPGHTFFIRTDQLDDSWFRQNVFRTLGTGPGDILGPPTLAQLNPIFTDNHYITPSIVPGTDSTTGSAGFTNEGANDFTPAAGSDLYDLHEAPKLAPCDAEEVARDTPTTVGALRGADEGSGAGTGPPSALDYNPGADGILQVIGGTGSLLPGSPITPTWDGQITDFTVEPSIYHIYQAQPEIPCTADMAHFEVRAWTAGDPTDATINPPTGHWNRVVVDLRNGHVYLKNPKSSGTAAFDALATAGNLCAPFAMDGGAVANGPWPAERPVIRYRGTALGGTNFFSGTSDIVIWGGTSSGNPSSHNVAWAGQAGLGGFYPLTGAWEGKGQQIVVSVIGATGSKTDKIIGPQEMGRGLKKTDGSYDLTTCAKDVLYKDILVSPNDGGFGVGGTTGQCFQAGGKDGMTGRLRLYDYGFWFANPSAAGLGGWGSKQLVEFGAGAHFDFRRGVYPPVMEHGGYFHQLNAGIFRDATAASGDTADSWFIELQQPNGSGRSLIQFQDRPYNHMPSGDPLIVNPATMTANKGGKGVVLVDRCSSDFGSDGTSKFTFQGGCDLTYILRDCSVTQSGALGQTVTKADGTQSTFFPTNHSRGIIIFGWYASGDKKFVSGANASAVRINSNGYMVKRAIIINYKDSTDHPTEKRMSFRGCEEVHIYSFDCKLDTGSARPVIGLDEEDSNPLAWYQGQALEQITNEGVIAYTEHGVPTGSAHIGTPISINGNKHPPNGRVFLYMGYPALPSAYAGWITSGGAQKIVGCIYPTPGAFVQFETPQIDALAGTPITLPAGLTLNQSTGAISGTPTAGIGKGSLGEFFGTEIHSPGTYTAGAPAYANIPIKGANSSRGDAWDGDGIQLLVVPLGPGPIFIVPHTAERRWAFDQITKIQDINIVTTPARRLWSFDQIAVEDTGGPDIVVPPESVTSWWFDPPLVGAGNTITPATAEMRWAFDQFSSGSTSGDEDGEGVGSGCQDGEGL